MFVEVEFENINCRASRARSPTILWSILGQGLTSLCPQRAVLDVDRLFPPTLTAEDFEELLGWRDCWYAKVETDKVDLLKQTACTSKYDFPKGNAFSDPCFPGSMLVTGCKCWIYGPNMLWWWQPHALIYHPRKLEKSQLKWSWSEWGFLDVWGVSISFVVMATPCNISPQKTWENIIKTVLVWMGFLHVWGASYLT